MAHPTRSWTAGASTRSPRATSTPSVTCLTRRRLACAGPGPLSGDHLGVDDILDFFARTMELTAGTFGVEFHDALANDEHTVAMYVARGEREGETLETRAC
jgi:hypothetical protein